MKLPEKGQYVPLSEVERLCDELGLLDVLYLIEDDPPEKPFKCDGCSYWPDHWKDKDGNMVCLYELCFIHDLQYWSGRKEEYIRRFLADVELMTGVVKKTGRVGLGLLMFLGVRLMGGSWTMMPFRWGFGRVE